MHCSKKVGCPGAVRETVEPMRRSTKVDCPVPVGKFASQIAADAPRQDASIFTNLKSAQEEDEN